MKHLFLGLLACILFNSLYAQYTGPITVNGDIDKFYPVTFNDEAWWDKTSPTEIEIGRPDIHENATVRGSMLAKFSFHVSNWGHGTRFINAEVYQNSPGTYQYFIAGWADASESNPARNIVIWLRGGGTTYHLRSNYPLTQVAVYDASPYVTSNGASYGHKTQIDTYVSATGTYNTGSIYISENSAIMGKLGIGTLTTGDYRLAVEGTIGARKVKVTQAAWADYVFDESYKRLSLADLENYIKVNRHLPGIPTEAEVKKDGVDVGEMNKKLLEKIEELTLYLIELKKEVDILKKK